MIHTEVGSGESGDVEETKLTPMMNKKSRHAWCSFPEALGLAAFRLA